LEDQPIKKKPSQKSIFEAVSFFMTLIFGMIFY